MPNILRINLNVSVIFQAQMSTFAVFKSEDLLHFFNTNDITSSNHTLFSSARQHATTHTHTQVRTCPSHMSSRAARSRAARASLLWNSLPSKKPQGQQCSHGNGWPHTSLMNSAVSTPAIKSEASCTPRASTFST